MDTELTQTPYYHRQILYAVGCVYFNFFIIVNEMNSMDSEQFFLKWNNFESNLASGFADLLQREAMVDVTLAAEGKIVQAHKIILSICSSYFKNMFQVNPCQHPIVVLKDVRYQELTDMLDFMYKGEANVRQEDLPSFLKLAETLRVKGLAGNQGELEENSINRNSEPQLPSITKDSSPLIRGEPSNEFLDKVTVARKKAKRCSSPLVYTDTKDLPHSPNIKLEMEECDSFLRNENNCGRSGVLKEERLGDGSIDSYGESHGQHESFEVEKIAGPSTPEENSEVAPQDTLLHTKNFIFVESRFGGHLLILDGYSYRRKSMTSEKSYWVCCNANCSAKGILSARGHFQVTHPAHSHKPDLETIKRKEKLVELKKLALQMNVPGQELLKALDIKDNVERHLGFIRTCRRRERKRKGHSFSPQTPLSVGLNYRLLPSRISSKEMLFHSGNLYRQDSRNPQNEKCKYWRCRVKECKARAKTNDGNLTILKPYHYHPAEQSGEGLNSFQGMVKTGSSACQKSTRETVNEANVKKENLTRFHRKVKKQTLKQKQEKSPAKEADSAVEETNPVFCSSATDSESFSFEKLMAETLAENYCVGPEFSDSIHHHNHHHHH